MKNDDDDNWYKNDEFEECDIIAEIGSLDQWAIYAVGAKKYFLCDWARGVMAEVVKRDAHKSCVKIGHGSEIYNELRVQAG